MRAAGATRASARGVTAVRIGSGALLGRLGRNDIFEQLDLMTDGI